MRTTAGFAISTKRTNELVTFPPGPSARATGVTPSMGISIRNRIPTTNTSWNNQDMRFLIFNVDTALNIFFPILLQNSNPLTPHYTSCDLRRVYLKLFNLPYN